MYENFTANSVKIILLAQEESRRMGHNFVCPAQILLATIGEETGIAAKVLKSMGVNLKDARIEVEKIIGYGAGFTAVKVPFSPKAKRALELAQSESRQFGHNYIGTEHLLLGTLSVEDGIALKVLENLGVDLTKIRPLVVKMLGENTEVINDPIRSTRSLLEGLRQKDSHEGMFDREIIELLRSVEQNTGAIVHSLNTLNENMIALSEQVEQIEGKLQS